MPKKELTLKDKLSRLTFTQACRILGPGGKNFIMQGGRFEISSIDESVYLDNKLFKLFVDGAVVTVTLNKNKYGMLNCNCNTCQSICAHAGAAFALILEEKTALGLAKPPDIRPPVESLSETELVKRALEERIARSKSENMTIKSNNPDILWTDYIVTNAISGKSYRVALRGWNRGESYCSCPDYRKNTLGTCKHIMAVTRGMDHKFSKDIKEKPYLQKGFAVHMLYGKILQLRMLCPVKVPLELADMTKPFKNHSIKDVHKLLQCVRNIEAASYNVNIYPDAQEYIEFLLYQERINNLVHQIRKNPTEHPLRKSLLKAELLPYQLDGIAFAVGAGRAILADDMGLGKTIQGIGVAEILYKESGIKKALVICPTSLKSQWLNEINSFTDKDCRLIIGSAPQRADQYNNDCFFTICNYEQVLRDIIVIEQVPWDLIIIDEGQRIKNWEAKTTQTIKSLRSRFALVLTGTPLENRLDDLFSIVEFVDERRLGPSFRFFNSHRIVDKKGKLLGYKNMDKLREKLSPILLRRTRKEVLKQLPQRTDNIIRIPPSAEQYDINSSQKRIIQTIVNKPYISEIDLLRLQKALLICRMAADSTFLVDKKPPGYSTKIQYLKDLLEELHAEEGRKIVLFSEWTTMLNLVEPLLKKLKMHYVRLDGSVPQKKRSGLVYEFQNNPECKLFMSTNAGSTGLNLQSANTVINVDLPWNPAVLEQRIARAHRMGQKNPVQVYILVTEDTIEEGMLNTLSAKKEIALAALDIKSKIKKVDITSGAEALKRRLEILLGRPDEAPLDVSGLEKQKLQAEEIAKREKVAIAAGQLFTSAFNLLEQLIPKSSNDGAIEKKKESIKNNLQKYITADKKGNLELKVVLPDEVALDNIAAVLSKLVQ